jgi:hypothetical protein
MDFQYGTSSDSSTHTFYQSCCVGNGDPLTSSLTTDSLLIGQHYSITSIGTTNWASVGASVFDLSLALTPTSMIIPGRQYIIASTGTTDFIAAGASSNAVGTIYTQNNAVIPSGTGITIETDFIATGTDAGTGTVDTIFIMAMNDLPPETYYWSVRANNQTQGVTGPSSLPIVWSGPNVSAPKVITKCEVSNVGTVLTLNSTSPPSNTTDGICVGGFMSIESGEGEFAPNTYVTKINSTTEFEVSAALISPLTSYSPPLNIGSCVTITCKNPANGNTAGGVDGGDIQDGTIPGDALAPGLSVGQRISSSSWTIATPPSTITLPTALAVNAPSYIGNTGGSIPASEYYPFLQGTSSTTKGYVANSTGGYAGFTPYGSQNQQMINGTDEWTVLNLESVLGGFRPGIDVINYYFYTQIVATYNCTVQFNGFITFTSLGSTLVTNTQLGIDTIELIANKPFIYRVNDYFVGLGGQGSGVGTCWRVLNFTGNPSTDIVISVSGDADVYVERG